MDLPTAVPAQSARIGVRPGLQLHTIVRPGAGAPAFLLVHGLASNARLWDGVAAHLSDAGYPSAAVDQRGHGLSDKPDDGYDFATVVEDLVLLMEALRYERPAVVGQSWGGNVVLELAWRHPELVSGIACVDGGTIELADRFPEWEECRATMSPPSFTGMTRTEIERRLRRAYPDWPDSGIEATLANFAVGSDGTVAPWLTLDRHLRILRALWEQRPSTLYAEIDVPVLLVPARGTRAEWHEHQRHAVERAAATLPRARIEWIDGDHDLHAQHPQAVADLLISCVASGFFR